MKIRIKAISGDYGPNGISKGPGLTIAVTQRDWKRIMRMQSLQRWFHNRPPEVSERAKKRLDEIQSIHKTLIEGGHWNKYMTRSTWRRIGTV